MDAQRALGPDSVLTIPEAAIALRISERTIFRLMAEGRLRRVKVGSRTLIRSKEIIRFVDTCEETL